MEKGARNRCQEDELVSRVVIQALAHASNVDVGGSFLPLTLEDSFEGPLIQSFPAPLQVGDLSSLVSRLPSLNPSFPPFSNAYNQV